MKRRMVTIVGVCIVLAAGTTPAGAWGWDARFTEASAPDVQEIHARIHSSGALGGAMGVPVRDATWTSDGFELHMIEGAVFLEPELDGYPAGALFVGNATVTLAPESRRAKSDLAYFVGSPALDAEPVSFAYVFTLAGASLLDQLGIESEATVPLAGLADYEHCKKAMRQLGMRVTHAFLNRLGQQEGGAYVLFAPDAMRAAGFDDALLLYCREPDRQMEVQVHVFGHKEAIRAPGAREFLERYPDYKYRFWPVTSFHADPVAFEPQGVVDSYVTRLRIGKGGNVDAETTLSFVPGQGVRAMRLGLTPRLRVESVTGPSGESLRFAQWDFLADDPVNLDQNLVVLADEPLPAGEPYVLKVVASGPLFDAWLGAWVLADEDTWYPRVNDPGPAKFELFCDIPKNMRAVGAGKLVSEEVDEGTRSYHYRTSRPFKRSTFYFGNYDVYEAKADKTKVELFHNSAAEEIASSITPTFGQDVILFSAESPKYTANEIANAVKIYNRVLGHDLELDHLRVAATPTGHGRGFEGLILLSKYGGADADQSAADFFRAHEVAHQWWGNMVDTRNWPEDRWLSESFAEYMAMEYFQYRFQKPEKTLAQMQELWIKPIFQATVEPTQTLTGQTRGLRTSETSPLIAGDQNVYTKGPLVVHMLRYLFEIQKKNDEAFWGLLHDFLDKHKYQQASTEDFMRLTEEHLQGRLDWFWDQWIYGTEIPKVRWSHEITRAEDGGWLVRVQAEQEDTEFVLAIPVHFHMKGGETLSTPLVLRGKHGRAQARFRDKPSKVTLNDNFDALVEIR